MDGARDLRLLLPEPVRRLPADLAATLGLVGLTLAVVFLPGVRETPLRVVVGLPFVLFLPGYALVAALFPEEGEPPTGEGAGPDSGAGADGASGGGTDAASGADGESGPDEEETTAGIGDRGIDGIERVALSFGLSIAVVPLIGLALNFTPWGIRLAPIMVSVSGFTVACTAVAARRRRVLPPDERFAVPYREWYAGARAELLQPDSRADAALNVLLALSVLLAAASVTYAVAVPKQGEQFTEFYVLTEDEEGELVAANYPTEFERGEAREVVLGIANREHETIDYAVVVELHRVRFEDGPNNTTRAVVIEEDELRRFHPTVAHNETWQRPYAVEPTMTGTRLRLTFMLYADAAPADPTVENAYRELHLWINVTDPDAG